MLLAYCVSSRVNEILIRQNKSAATEDQILNALNNFVKKDDDWKQRLIKRLDKIVKKLDSFQTGGNNNVQYIYEGPSVESKSYRYTQGIRPTTDPKSVFGRQQELKRIDKILETCTSLAITGFRGTGKSTLASMYIDRMEERGKYTGIYWRKVDETIDISDVVGSFFTVIGKPIEKLNFYKVEDLIGLLFQELEALPYFLVFDNFEALINPQNNEPLKPGFSELIEKANEIAGESRILFTCWECPASDRGIKPEWYQIGGLDPQAATKLLRKKGLTEAQSELTQVIERSGGHPLALILLVQLVKEEAETLSQALADESLWKGEVAEKILDKVYSERLSDGEHRILQFVSLFREPVPLSSIIAVANDQAWTEMFAKKLALNLNRKSLLNKTNENYWEESLIHSYAYSKMGDQVFRHTLACDYYLSLPLPEAPMKKEEVQPLIEAHYHACMAKEYDKAAQIILEKNLGQNLTLWGNYRTLLADRRKSELGYSCGIALAL
jgi:hypothetical protein